MTDHDAQPTGLDSALALETDNQVDYFQVAAALERQLAAVEAERDSLKKEFIEIDAALARRPIFDDLKTRAQKVWKACDSAAILDRELNAAHSYKIHFKTLESKLEDSEQALKKALSENERLQAEVTQLTRQNECLTIDIDTLLESSTLLAEDSEVEEARLHDCLATAETDRDCYKAVLESAEFERVGELPARGIAFCKAVGIRASEEMKAALQTAKTDRNHAIATLVSATASLADAGFKGETVKEQVASVVARVAELESDLLAERRAHGSTQVNLKIATAQLEEAEHHAKRYSIEYDRAKADADEAKADNVRLRRQSTSTMLALESLTPGGSEFVGDVEACVHYVRKSRAVALDTIRRLHRWKRQAEAEALALRQQVREIGEKVKAKAITLLEYQCEMAEENHAEFGVCNGIQIALNTINSSLDLAACGAKAEEAENK